MRADPTRLSRAHGPMIPIHPPNSQDARNLAHFFLSELSVSGGTPTTVTVPCSTFSGAAITKGSSLQRRFFVCGGKTLPRSWPCRMSVALSTQEWDNTHCSPLKAPGAPFHQKRCLSPCKPQRGHPNFLSWPHCPLAGPSLASFRF